MEENDIYEHKLTDILQKEIAVLSTMLEVQKQVKMMVTTRKWPFLEEKFYKIATLADEFTNLDANRILTIRELSKEKTDDIYQISMVFTDQVRTTLHELFREMKRLLLASKIENESLNKYVSFSKKMLQSIFEKAIPEQRSKIYTRKGALADRRTESLLINQSL